MGVDLDESVPGTPQRGELSALSLLENGRRTESSVLELVGTEDVERADQQSVACRLYGQETGALCRNRLE